MMASTLTKLLKPWGKDGKQQQQRQWYSDSALQKRDTMMSLSAYPGSDGIYGYHMDPTMYVRADRVMAPLGILGGNTVSTYQGSMVDLESNLSGRSPTLTIPHVLPSSDLRALAPPASSTTSYSSNLTAWKPFK
jgi:hypothetical protein